MWTVTSGSAYCTVTTGGWCVESLANYGNLEQCTAVSAMCNEQATTEVQRALAAANDMAAQIGATLGAIGGCVPTATDLAIAPPNGENQGVNQVDAAAEMLRRRRAAQQDVKMLSTMAAGSLLKM